MLHKKFSAISTSGSHICCEDLFFFLKEERNAFVDQIFSMLDFDRTGKLSFVEFLGASYIFGTMSHAELVAFSFQLYDKGNKGVLSKKDIETLAHHVYGTYVSKSEVGFIVTGNHTSKKTAEILMNSFDADQDGCITLKEFVARVKHSPFVLFPAFRFHERFRSSIGGDWFWEQETRKCKSINQNNDMDIHAEIRQIFKASYLGNRKKKALASEEQQPQSHAPDDCPGSREATAQNGENAFQYEHGTQARKRRNNKHRSARARLVRRMSSGISVAAKVSSRRALIREPRTFPSSGSEQRGAGEEKLRRSNRVKTAASMERKLSAKHLIRRISKRMSVRSRLRARTGEHHGPSHQ